MRVKLRRRAPLVVLLLALAAVTACSSDSAAPRPAVTTIGSVATHSQVAPSPTVAPSSDATADETQDRLAVQAAWAAYWHTYDTLLSQPQSTWVAAVAKVAVDPIASELLKQDRAFAAAGVGSYGQAVLHPYWAQRIDGKATATLMDCQDDSHAGSLVVATGVKRTVGRANNLIEATLTKGADEVWRVEQIAYLAYQKCEV